MWIIAYAVGILALIFLSRADSVLSSNIGWVIVALLMIDYSARSGLKKDVEVNGAHNNTVVTKSWIITGLIAEFAIVALSVYVFVNM